MPAVPTLEDLVSLNRLTLVARLMAGTTHDVNNALQIISGSSEVLGSVPEMNAAARRAVERIQSQAARAAATVHELIEFAKNERNAPTELSMRDVAAKAVRLRGFAARRAGIALTFDAASAAPDLVRASESRLLQAMLNLLINAEQALQGTTGGTILVTVQAEDAAIAFSVVDNGRGVAPSMSDRLFEPFATTKPVPDASGLGLVATRTIARGFGGECSVAPSLPGCTATLTLPRADSRPTIRP
jgi:two-component system, NtrC family, C4-dicarboxylate transport sensor histidine kinase DctB